jgi:hypothetical protein
LKPYIEAMKDAGTIARSDISEDQIYTNQFVSEFNKFDTDAAIKRAKEAKAAIGPAGN